MKSRYLCRGKRTDNGEWVEGFYFCMTHPDGGHMHHFIIPLGADLSLGTTIEKIQVEIDPSTICWCTGLEDKNGILIWENDIIEKEFYSVPDYYANSKKYMGTIQYENGGWYVNVVTDDIAQGYEHRIYLIEAIANSKDLEHFEIIGNSFDNPELLMEEEKEI